MTLRLLPALLLLGAAPLAAQIPSDSVKISADSAKGLAAKGKVLFEGKGLCVTCHGKDGEGLLGPTTRLTGDKGWIHMGGSLPELIALITSGVSDEDSKSGAMMPPKGGSRLTEAEVEQVAYYVQALHRRKADDK